MATTLAEDGEAVLDAEAPLLAGRETVLAAEALLLGGREAVLAAAALVGDRDVLLAMGRTCAGREDTRGPMSLVSWRAGWKFERFSITSALFTPCLLPEADLDRMSLTLGPSGTHLHSLVLFLQVPQWLHLQLSLDFLQETQGMSKTTRDVDRKQKFQKGREEKPRFRK